MAVFDFQKTEQRIRDFWESHHIFEKSLALRQDEKRFVFFEGPPTANGRAHIGHFLTRIFKDLYGRYKTMQGFFVLRKAGWDTHGLPVELEVEKELGFKNKKQIEEYGVAAFNKKAKESVWKYKREWEEMTKRMGFWLDLNHPYITYETPYIESLWAIIRKIWEKDLLYQAHRVVPFCTRCGTPLSSHEVAQGYKLIKENSVYLKFKLKSAKYPNTSILAWTTTPWTLPGNLALAIGNDIDYIIAKSKSGDDRIIMARDLFENVAGYDYEIERELKGSELVGLEYEPLFEVPQLKSEKSYRVYPADFVSTQEGTGVVHTAVMYGEDDYTLGTKIGLPKVHTVDEQGKFMGVSPELDGKYVKAEETQKLILDHLRKNGTLFKETEYEHDYPFCWRCDTPLLYYAKTSWFIKMSAVNRQLLANNDKINWVPAHLKEGRFGRWLKEGKDWAFSRERYWGTPLPVWQCEKCKKHFVAGSLEDLEKRRARKPNRFFLMRHGVTNRGTIRSSMIINSYPGEYDIYELTEEGQAQAQKAAKELKSKGVDLIIASPFKRTQQTAEIMANALGVSFETDERLGEIKHGLKCEGKTYAECVPEGTVRTMDTKHDDVDSWRSVKARMMGVITELDGQHEGKNILIISHGDPIWLLTSAIVNLNDQETVARRPEIFPAQGTYREYALKNYPYNDLGEVDLHRPYVDAITLACQNCGGVMRKVPDLIDGWFDSGSMPYAQWHWPFENKDTFKDQFPADFIVEGVDQTRGWFYTLLAVATLLDMDAPYKNVMSLGHTLDGKGKKMSKSIGNVIYPGEFMDTVGVDAARWYFYTLNAPEDPKIVTIKDAQDRLKGFLTTLENCVRFYELYEKDAPREDMELTLLDKWMLSRLNRTILDATKCLDEYNPTTAARLIETLVVEDLSKWWLRRSRDRIEAVGILRYLMFVVAKLAAPFIPYTAEDIYERIGGRSDGTLESVHLTDWPKGDSKMINEDLEQSMARVKEIISKGLAIRKENQLKVRQPLAACMVPGEALKSDLEELIKAELNVKKIEYKDSGEVTLDLNISPELRAEGYAREAMRQIQDMRKEAKYHYDEKALVYWHTDDQELAAALNHWKASIEKETILSDFVQGVKDDKAHDVEKEAEIVPGKKIWLGIQK